jgi:hypothetical protein
MMRIIAILAILALVPTGIASIDCICSRPAAPGITVGFSCEFLGGTTDNVSIYLSSEPELGMPVEGWAMKNKDGAQLPINYLTVIVEKDSQEVKTLTTDKNGYFSFDLDGSGMYEIYGGDAKLDFIIAIEEPQEAQESAPETEEPDDALNGDEPTEDNESGEADEADALPDEENTTQEPEPKTSIPDDSFIYLAIAILAIAALAVTLIKTRKCSPQRKSSGISGKRRA